MDNNRKYILNERKKEICETLERVQNITTTVQKKGVTARHMYRNRFLSDALYTTNSKSV